ncbi:MAG TPA: hypothetical protein VE871_17950 [Longimicrobium sp.]|nr:hypothetical protein [Longimicrobium sp.]
MTRTAHMTGLAKVGRGRRGVALPVALVGLVVMSLLVTTVLLTSTTEGAISAAQANGARALYNAEGGLSEVLRAAMVAQQPLPVGQQTLQLAESRQRVRVTTALLRSHVPDAAFPNVWTRTYSLTAEPVNAGGQTTGRAVVAMIRQERKRPDPLSMNITSAITLGGDMHVNGNAFTVSGRSNACGANGGVDAVRAASDSEITTNNTNHFNNFNGYDNGQNTSGQSAIERSNLTRDQLKDNVLQGKSVEEIIATVPLSQKFGPRWHAVGTPNRTWDGRIDAGDGGVAVIDANRGTVEIQGGSGVVIIVNGNLLMKGNSSFAGIIIVEGNFTLSGNPTVTGALVSLAMQGENEIQQDDSAIANGSITVQYDKCAIDGALQKFGDAAHAAPATIMGTTFAWSEVVR